jgi:phosphoglycerate kinase
MELPKIQQAGNLKGKRVLVRVGFNVPIVAHRVADDFRLRRTVPTIEYLKKKGAKIILISHIGRDPKETLRPVANYFNRSKNFPVGFVPDVMAENVRDVIANMQNGSVVLLENLRQYPGEKENDLKFAKYLASLGDVYVNDAFSVSHRKSASVVGITKYLPSYAGLLFQDEVKHLSMALAPNHPFLFMLGGAKIETKMPLLRKFTKVADTVFVGGALANDLFKAKGIEVGTSLADDSVKGLTGIASHKRVVLPHDVLVEGGKNGEVRALDAIGAHDIIVDVGSKTRREFSDLVAQHKFVVLNGPIGWYEKGYDKGTKKLLKVLADSPAKVIVGGGDTVALVAKMKLEDSFLFVSTGGGAMLDFLIDGKLPGIDALTKSRK